jgi:tetratricopeptide (TPR) repeat protein
MSDLEQVIEEALSLGDQGRWQEMAELLTRALDDAPDDPYVLCWLGMAERELDNEGRAYELFKQCLASDPIDPHLLAMAGAGLAAFDDPDAEAALRAAALSGPDLPMTRLQYGAYLAREGLFDEALEHLRAALALAPEDPVMHAELGIAHALKGDMTGAADSMESALDAAPDDSWTRLLLGLVYVELGRSDDAATALVQASRERTDDAEAQILGALAASAAGWDDAAEEALARAEFAAEGSDVALIHEAEDRLAAGASASRELLMETLGPSVLHERLIQPL